MTAQPIITVQQSNFANIAYIRGDGSQEGDIRLIYDTDSQDPAVQKRQNGVWNLGSWLVGGSSLLVDRNVRIGAAGQFAFLSEETTETEEIFITARFNDETSFPARVPVLGPTIPFLPIRPIFDTEYVGTSFGQPSAVAALNTLTTHQILRTGSVGATSEVLFTIKRGIDETGVLIHEERYPASDFPANSLITLKLNPRFNFPITTTVFSEWSSDEDFSLLGDDSFNLFLAVTTRLYFFEDLVSFGTGTDSFLSGSEGHLLTNSEGQLMYGIGPQPTPPPPPLQDPF